MLMALLLPDPCDVNCPPDFREEARRLLKPMPNCGATGTNKELRNTLLQFIADFANWDNSAKPAYLECSRGLVKAAHGEEPPLVVDPFAGGGSIPLEALRIGCGAFASDLNPVACLILKVLLEDIPRHGPKLAEELRTLGKQIKEEAEKELAGFYPPDPDGARPIAFLWARTVRCEAVGCGAEIPLMRSFWLCKKANRRRALKLVHERDPNHPKEPLNTLTSERGNWSFEIFEPESESEVRGGTVTRGNAMCPCCNTVLPVARVRAQLATERGGADVRFDGNGTRVGGARLLTVVTLDEKETGRQYRLPTERDYEAAWNAEKRLEKVLGEWERGGKKGLCPVPDEPTPVGGGSGAGRAFSVQKYGMLQWGDLFTARQKLALTTIANAVRRPESTALSLALGKLTDLASSGCLWHTRNECPNQVLTTGRVKPFWDFAEGVPTSESSGSLQVCVDKLIGGVLSARVGESVGDVAIAAAQRTPLGDESAQVWFTDPPYYDAIAYSDLSDFFFVWLKRALPGHPLLRDPDDPSNPLTPKEHETVQDDTRQAGGRPKDRNFFEQAMAESFMEGRRVSCVDGMGCVVFAHKTTEGWEALLSGMIRSGWMISGSWPIATEMTTRLRARESAALATSVHLVCRPRAESADIGGWEDILRELPNRTGDWMERLSTEGIRGADLVFSCVGPALELFSKYDKVETAEGREVKLDEFLAKVWEVVGRTALQQVLGTAEAKARNSAAGALEEDARLTALFLWTLQSTDGNSKLETRNSNEEDAEAEEDEEETSGKAKRGYVLIYDVVRRFAQPLGIHLETWEGRVIETKKGRVRLIPVQERREKLFGEAGTEGVAQAIERSHGESPQFALFPDEQRVPDVPIKTRKTGRGRTARVTGGGGKPAPPHEATTLDRVHAAMLLQAGGQATALRAMLETETQRSPDFLRLANALSALYPKESEEKRLLDAMLLAVPR
jgi:adenine-specific DNA methylase